MKTFFTITALLFIAILVSIYIAGYSSKMIRTSQDSYTQKVTQQIKELTVAIDTATEHIKALEDENKELQETISTLEGKSKTTTKKTSTTPPAQPVAIPPTKKILNNSVVSLHSKQEDCWIIVERNVYSVGSYISMHPGGKNVLINQCGKDATQAFTTQGGEGRHSKTAWSLLGQFLVGALGETLN